MSRLKTAQVEPGKLLDVLLRELGQAMQLDACPSIRRLGLDRIERSSENSPQQLNYINITSTQEIPATGSLPAGSSGGTR
jgi:hypothetical protein